MSSITFAAEPLSVERIFADPDLSGSSPRVLKLSPDGARATFLKGRPDDADRMDLWEYRVDSGKTQLLVDSLALMAGKAEKLSDEEKARRERARISSLSGIVSYQFSDDGKNLLFPLSGELYSYQLAQQQTQQLTDGEGFATDPKFSPLGRYVSFVRERNLWLIDRNNGKTRQLTSKDSDTVAWGMAEFVAQEEMHRLSGYWWSPQDDAIVAARFDEAPVPIAKRSEIYADRTDVISQRYPAAGENNVLIELYIVDPSGKQAPKKLELGDEKDIYIARVNWLKDGSGVLVQRQDRKQQRLDLIYYPREGGKGKLLLSEKSSTWVNLNEDMRTLKDGRFIWASERSGFKHLYLYSADAKLLDTITQGPWQVDEVTAVDEKRGQIYFTASKQDVIEKQLYRVGFNGGAVSKVSEQAGWHDISFSDDASIYLDNWSDDLVPNQISLHSADGVKLTELSANQLDPKHPLTPFVGALQTPQYGTITHQGVELQYQLLTPPEMEKGKQYPVFLRVYGGPGSQQVQRRWDKRWGLLDQYMAQQGFVVFTLDNRGSERRGKAFEDPIYRNMGDVEVQDQLAGIEFLKSHDFVDPKRIGVFGWSYGGYMTLMMLAKAS